MEMSFTRLQFARTVFCVFFCFTLVHYCFPVAVLRGTPYQNNSVVTLEDIGEGDDALLCITFQTTCCRPPYSGGALGNWFFPNGTRVPSSGAQWDFHRTRGQMVIVLHHRRGGVEGIYHCEIPNTFGFTQTIYIGVYSASTGEWLIMFCSYCNACVCVLLMWSDWEWSFGEGANFYFS